MANKQPFQLTARSLALTDVIPTQAADGATEVGKNTIQDVVDLIPTQSGNVITLKTSISSAQILAFNTTPIVVMPAAGAGKVIIPLNIYYQYNYNTVTYATFGGIVGYYQSSGLSVFNSSNIIFNSEDAFNKIAPIATTSDIGSLDNQAIVLSVTGGNPTAGNGTLDVYASYIEITL